MGDNNIINKKKLPDILSDSEFEYYFKKFIDGNIDALNILVVHNIKLVYWYIDNNIECDSFNYDDIFSVGLEALLEAFYKFDLDKNIKFSTFATVCIRNKICKYFRSESKHNKVVSFDNFISDGYDADTYADMLIDYNINIEDDFIENDLDMYLKCEVIRILDSFDELEKKIIMFYYGFYDKCYTQQEISKKLGISQPKVSRLLSESLRKFRMQLDVLDSKSSVKGKKIIKRVA